MKFQNVDWEWTSLIAVRDVIIAFLLICTMQIGIWVQEIFRRWK